MFASMLESRELRNLDAQARHMALAKAEQAFVEELSRIDRRVVHLLPSKGGFSVRGMGR